MMQIPMLMPLVQRARWVQRVQWVQRAQVPPHSKQVPPVQVPPVQVPPVQVPQVQVLMQVQVQRLMQVHRSPEHCHPSTR